MVQRNPTRGEERIAAGLLLKLGVRMSPRTVRRYMAPATAGGSRRVSGEHWATFVRNHVHRFLACDFCVAIMATFQVL